MHSVPPKKKKQYNWLKQFMYEMYLAGVSKFSKVLGVMTLEQLRSRNDRGLRTKYMGY